MSIVHIPFYPSDWLAGTRGMSDAETGVYITLVSRMYEMAAPIERDDDRLWRLCGCKSKSSFLKSLKYLISEGKILDTPEGLFNERAQKVIKETTEKSAKAKAAAQSRWDRKPSKNNGDDYANASLGHMPGGCQSKPEPEPYIDDDDSACANPTFREKVLVAAGHPACGLTATGKIVGNMAEWQSFSQALSDLSIDEPTAIGLVEEVARRKRDGPATSLKYFIGALQKFAGARDAPPLRAVANGAGPPPASHVEFDLKSFLAENPELNR